MKKLIALLILVSAVSAFSYGVNQLTQYPNELPRGDMYQDGFHFWVKDFVHGQPGNPYNDPYWANHGIIPPPIQLDDQGTFMWQSGNILTRPQDLRDQFYYLELCEWMDLPDYVGCTEYFFLFIYKPLCIYCVCETYKCLGIFSIPSHHIFYGEGSNNTNPFNGGAQNYWCTWRLVGQENWFVTLSGEILENPIDPEVTVTWYWEGGQTDVVAAGPQPGAIFPIGNNWTQQIQLGSDGLYYMGLAATSVTIGMAAIPGVHTYEATVSGYYSL